MEGLIVKAVSGFYYVQSGGELVECRARGRFRKDGVTPLVGDRVVYTVERGKGTVRELLPRRNAFIRPAVANLDALVVLASAVIPVTEPFLIDRITAIAGEQNVPVLLCVNKVDLNGGDELAGIYRRAGYPVFQTSAETGEGIEALREAIRGKVVAFTGNSGVGKSSVLNRLDPGFGIRVGEISDKLGRGRHFTACRGGRRWPTRRAFPPSIPSEWSWWSRKTCNTRSPTSRPTWAAANSTTVPISGSQAVRLWTPSRGER